MNIYQETLSLKLGPVEIQMKKRKCSLPLGNLQSGWTDEINSMKHYERVLSAKWYSRDDTCCKNPENGEGREAREKGFLEVMF